MSDFRPESATGQPCPAITLTDDPRENEKRLIMLLLSGTPLVAIDNANDEELGGAYLCQMIEQSTMTLRALGSTERHIIPNSFTTFANGNNLNILADLVRRTIKLEMDANREAPEEREFHHDPALLITSDRGRYVAAALTICRAYVAAGKPDCLPPLPSFTEWSDLVRSALVWLGCADPVESIASLRTSDPVRSHLARVFHAWAINPSLGLTHWQRSADVVKATESDLDLRDALLDAINHRHQSRARRAKPMTDVTAHGVGMWLAANENRIASGFKLEVDAQAAKNKRAQWRLVDLNT